MRRFTRRREDLGGAGKLFANIWSVLMKVRDLLCLFSICGWKLWADRLRLITRKNFLTVGGIQLWDTLSGKESSEFAIIVGV